MDEYVAKPDAAYAWQVVQTQKVPGGTVFTLEMTSQTWRSPDEVSQSVWKHWLVVAKPDVVRYSTAFLMIGGGRNGGSPPAATDNLITTIAAATGTVTAELRMVPNQPIIFFSDGKERFEDDLVAYTWNKVLETGDVTWSARFPMVKSAVRAMDTVQAFLRSEAGGGVEIRDFVVAGGSKRGWTTWLTAAVDPRVKAAVPIVIDVLNCEPSLRHHYAAYGFWAPAVHDYVDHNILQRLGEPGISDFLKVEDPYFYRHRLTMPKYVVNASGDQFFPPDSPQFYFDDLQGEKYLRVVPNTDHGLKNSDALQTIIGFYQLILDDAPRPRVSWRFPGEGVVEVESADKPQRILLWQATNPEARDFRLVTIGPSYTSQPLEWNAGRCFARVPRPEKGWTVYFVELTFPVKDDFYLKVTTPPRVVPDTLPFADAVLPGTNLRAGE
ncbi:PhoPQ-activated pathogenicity-related family protein [Thermopirellula anaerolimosa]